MYRAGSSLKPDEAVRIVGTCDWSISVEEFKSSKFTMDIRKMETKMGSQCCHRTLQENEYLHSDFQLVIPDYYPRGRQAINMRSKVLEESRKHTGIVSL